jgi:hypothetical protein
MQDTRYGETGGISSPRVPKGLPQAALNYAKIGIPIFPCRPDSKAPMPGFSVHDASADLAQVELWWRQWPDANIGFCPASRQAVVVDADPRKAGFDPGLLRRLEPEARFAQRTAAGDPLHMFFHSDMPHTGRIDLAPGFSCYSDAEHVLLSPSRIGGNTYRVLKMDRELSPLPDWAEGLRREIGNGQVGSREEWELPDGPEPAAGPNMAQELGRSDNVKFHTFASLRALKIPPPQYLLRPFLRKKGTMMIAAFRGIGKTWTGYNLAMSLAGGVPMLDWKPENPDGVPVLYVDGEMALDEVRSDRLVPMFAGLPPAAQRRVDRNLFYLSHEDFEHGIPDLTEDGGRGRAIVEAVAERTQAKVIILDNKSTLFRSLSETDPDAQASTVEWLLKLRRAGYAIILIHHGTKPDQNGRSHQRGTSRVEDIFTMSVMLQRLPGMGSNEFIWEWAKYRSFCPEALEFPVRIGPAGWLELAEPSEDGKDDTIWDMHKANKPYTDIRNLLKVSNKRIKRVIDARGEGATGVTG